MLLHKRLPAVAMGLMLVALTAGVSHAAGVRVAATQRARAPRPAPRVTPYALHSAARAGDMARLRKALASGADVNAPDGQGRTALSLAVLSARAGAVHLLLEKGADVDVVDRGGWTPLHHAAWAGHEPIVELLLTGGAQHDLFTAAGSGRVETVREVLQAGRAAPAGVGPGGKTAIHWAAHGGNREVIELLLAQGWDASVGDTEERTPLHEAAASGRVTVMRLLLAGGAKTDPPSIRGMTPLYEAARAGQAKAVKLLLAKGAKATEEDLVGNTPLHVAAEKGHVDVMALLLAKGVPKNPAMRSGTTPIQLAARSGNTDAVRLLLKAGVRFSEQDLLKQNAIGHMYRRNEAMVRLILTEGMKITSPEARQVALGLAIDLKLLDIAEALIAKGADPSKSAGRKGMPLHLAARKGDTDTVLWLLERGVKADSVDSGGGTALHVAAQTGRIDTVRLLLDRGASVDAPIQATSPAAGGPVGPRGGVRRRGRAGRTGRTPLHSAASGGHEAVVELLLKRGADVNAAAKNGRTSLHESIGRFGGGPGQVGRRIFRMPSSSPVARRRLQVTRQLLAAGANVHAADKRGRTPLHGAAGGHNTEAVKLLLAAGADPTVADTAGATPLDLAKLVQPPRPGQPEQKIPEPLLALLTRAAATRATPASQPAGHGTAD